MTTNIKQLPLTFFQAWPRKMMKDQSRKRIIAVIKWIASLTHNKKEK